MLKNDVARCAGVGAFFTVAYIEAATMTELAEARAKRGFCPKCHAKRMRNISICAGLVFRKCADCGAVAVLGA